MPSRKGALKREYTLCWDCAKACGGCEWSDGLEPVEGWTALKSKKKICNGRVPDEKQGYFILTCPLFDQDAVGGGQKKLGETRTFKKYQELFKRA